MRSLVIVGEHFDGFFFRCGPKLQKYQFLLGGNLKNLQWRVFTVIAMPVCECRRSSFELLGTGWVPDQE